MGTGGHLPARLILPPQRLPWVRDLSSSPPPPAPSPREGQGQYGPYPVLPHFVSGSPPEKPVILPLGYPFCGHNFQGKKKKRKREKQLSQTQSQQQVQEAEGESLGGHRLF